jgi:hypothetical protein
MMIMDGDNDYHDDNDHDGNGDNTDSHDRKDCSYVQGDTPSWSGRQPPLSLLA